MKAPGYNWLKYGSYVLFIGGLLCSVFGWLAAMAGTQMMGVLIYCMQALLCLFAAVDSNRSKNSPRRARNCAIDAMCVIALSVIVMIQTQMGFSWYILPALIGAGIVIVGAFLNMRAK